MASSSPVATIPPTAATSSRPDATPTSAVVPEKPSAVVPAKPPPLRLELLRADVRSISSINQIDQRFSARIFVQFRVHGGDRYDQLCSGLGADGAAPFKSASWYLNTLRWTNSCEAPSVLQNLVNKAGGDRLDLVTEVEGQFLEHMELQDFPLDRQELTVKLQSLCANEGGVPVEFTGLDTAALNVISERDFVLANQWELQPSLSVTQQQIKLQEGRSYPTLAFTLRVHRRCGFYMANVQVPMSLFSLMSFVQYRVPAEEVTSRMSIALTLMLTSVAYKYVIVSMLPAVSYLTLLDKFVLANCCVILLNAFENALVAQEYTYNDEHGLGGAPDWQFRVPVEWDRVALYAGLGLWLLVHVYFAARVGFVACRRAKLTRRWMLEQVKVEGKEERASRYAHRIAGWSPSPGGGGGGSGGGRRGKMRRQGSKALWPISDAAESARPPALGAAHEESGSGAGAASSEEQRPVATQRGPSNV